MNENRNELNLEDLDAVSGGNNNLDSKFDKCPYCDFTTPRTAEGIWELKTHIETTHPNPLSNPAISGPIPPLKLG